MNTIICVTLLVCATMAYASALPAEDLPVQPAAAAVATVEDDVLEGAEQRWGGRGWGGGYGRGWGGGYGGGRGWGGGYGGGWGGGRGWGGRGYGNRGWGGYGWGR